MAWNLQSINASSKDIIVIAQKTGLVIPSDKQVNNNYWVSLAGLATGCYG
jgi:hypothetical protein